MRNILLILMMGLNITWSQMISYHSDSTGEIMGYLSKPKTNTALPGIILIHEWWGLNQDIKNKADEFAKNGYVALAVDLYQGKSTTSSKEARNLAGKVRSNTNEAFKNLESALDFLKSLDNVNKNKLASVGWCFGGGWSYLVAKNNLDVKKIDKEEITERFDTLVFGKEKETLKHSLASCCNPIPGDPVFGYITVNDGIKVHKKECSNALSLQSNFAYRIISSKWIDSSSNEYKALLKLSGIDNMGIVSDVTQLISNEMNVNIDKIRFDSDDGIFTGLISVRVKNQTILNRLASKLLRLKGIDKVLRE